MKQGSRCNEDNEDKFATRMTCSAQGTPQSFALFTLSSFSGIHFPLLSPSLVPSLVTPIPFPVVSV